MDAREIFMEYIRTFSECKDRAFFESEGFDFNLFEAYTKNTHHKYACIAENRDKMILHFNFTRINRIYGRLHIYDDCPTNWKIYIYKY